MKQKNLFFFLLHVLKNAFGQMSERERGRVSAVLVVRVAANFSSQLCHLEERAAGWVKCGDGPCRKSAGVPNFSRRDVALPCVLCEELLEPRIPG